MPAKSGQTTTVLLIDEQDTTLWSVPSEKMPEVVGGELVSCLSTDAFVASLQKKQPVAYFLPCLPDGGRIVGLRQATDVELVVVEYPPHLRSILFADAAAPNSRVHYRLAFPWVYICLSFNDGRWNGVYHFYRNGPATEEDNVLGCPNLYNTATDGYVCMGKGLAIPLGARSLHQQVEWGLRMFWGGVRNTEIVGAWNVSTTLQGHPNTLIEWQRMSEQDPQFILKIPWMTINTLQHVLTATSYRWDLAPSEEGM